MKESRLFQMLYYILERGKVTAPELAEKFELSVRTVYRDIDWISNAGIPIYATRGKNGGIEIDRSFVINKAMLSAEEKEQIMIALNNTDGISLFDQQQLISKLSTLFNVKNTHWIDVDASSWNNQTAYQKLFEDIKFAIINKRIILFDYASNKLETTRRKVKPIRLVFKSWTWYLYAFCTLRNDFRFFKLSRINRYQLSDDIYDDDYSTVVIKKEIDQQKTVHVKLKFNKSQASRVYDDFYDSVVETADGLLVEADFSENYLCSYILSFGADVKVIEPAEIKIKIKSILNKMLKQYEN